MNIIYTAYHCVEIYFLVHDDISDKRLKVARIISPCIHFLMTLSVVIYIIIDKILYNNKLSLKHNFCFECFFSYIKFLYDNILLIDFYSYLALDDQNILSLIFLIVDVGLGIFNFYVLPIQKYIVDI